MLTKLFTALAVTAGVASAAGNAPVGKFNGYWGQNGYDRLKDRCDESPDYVSLSFVNVSPENGNGTGLPGTNFAGHCGAEWYYKDGRKSRLLKACDQIAEDIPYCQSKGIKVLLSIGGVWSDNPDWYSDYTVSNRENGVEFAKILSNAFGTPRADYDGPRPFGDVVVDGFDFDIEKNLDNKPWIAMIQALRRLNPSYFISGAPQCPLSKQYFDMREMIQQAHFDALFIQFYNNPGCDLIAGNTEYEEKFNYDEWEKTIAASEKSKDAKLYIGLPADAKDGAHVAHEPLKQIVCKYAKRSSFGGISLWDMYLGSENKVDGKTYNEWIREILDNGCDEETTTTKATTTMPTTTKATTTVPTTTKATSKLTTKPWGNSTTTGADMTTSTVYTTRTYTVTSCAPTVTNCPVGHVTTEVVPVYTTVCPVSEVQTHPGHQEPTTTVQKTVIVVPTDTGIQTSVRPTMSKPADNNNCPGGPNCPAVSQPADNNCPGPNCPVVTKPADNNDNCPGGPNCPPGVAVPTGGHGNNTIPGKPLPPVTGSASSMAVGLTGLVAAVAAQALLL